MSSKPFNFATRRLVLRATAAYALAALSGCVGTAPRDVINVYKSPTCGCCGDWIAHLRANGFKVEAHNLGDVALMRRGVGVPVSLASCHTAIIDGYAIEGHVPAADIKRLLQERPKILGLAVPSMVVGSPGMEQGPPQPYDTLAFDDRGHRVFARH